MTEECRLDFLAARGTHTLIVCSCGEVSEGTTVREAVAEHNRHVEEGSHK